MNNSVTINKDKLIIVEGDDDSKIVDFLLKSLQINSIQTICIGGKDKLKDKDAINRLSVSLKTSKSRKIELKALGIVLDADEKGSISTFQKICSFIRKLNTLDINGISFDIPKKCAEFTHCKIPVGIYIMPDCISCGMIETLCLQAPSDFALYEKSKEFIESINSELNHKEKRIVQSYISIAAKDRVYRMIGNAFEAGLFDIKNPAFDKIKNFLTEMSKL